MNSCLNYTLCIQKQDQARRVSQVMIVLRRLKQTIKLCMQYLAHWRQVDCLISHS